MQRAARSTETPEQNRSKNATGKNASAAESLIVWRADRNKTANAYIIEVAQGRKDDR